MYKELKELLNNTESKWSGFGVSSIIVDVNGNRYKGVNVEYAVPSNDICAERNAISTAYTEGMNKGELKEVHILGGKTVDPDTEYFVPPCGICRQAITEASNGKAVIYLYNFDGEVKQYTIEELLPMAFLGDKI